MIPKIIHQIWIGNKKMPVEWMQTWYEKNPSMKQILWNEEKIKEFGLKNRDKYEFFTTKGEFPGAADIARVEILKKFGGVYVDADSICLESVENEWFMEKDFFAGIEYDRRVGNGIVGTIPNHPIMVDYFERLTEATVIEPPCYTIGGTMLTSCTDSFVKSEKVAILPKNCFYPKWKRRGEIKEKIYTRQMWGSTKNLYKDEKEGILK